LVTKGVPAQALSIVGADVTLVERVTGRIGYGRAALSSAMSGSWLGVLAGLVYVIISPTDIITPIVGGLFIGAGVGMVAGMLILTFSKAPQRLYRSMQQVIAQSYRVVVDAAQHSEALQAMESGDSESES
jgi:LytS/YehU family sensor histidine kinase